MIIHAFRFLFFLVLWLTFQSSLAQGQGKISGNLIDNNQPVEFATVSLAKLPDSTKILFLQNTDSLGRFLIDQIAFGTYNLKISLIGYVPLLKTVIFSSENKNQFFENIKMQPDGKNLNEVVVKSQKKLIEKTNEGFIVNASANITQLGGTATDVLKNTPTVAVDADGVITLRGKTPLILINGRNSNLANADQIPASSIESIEVINSASAKYDANAESGIINIRLKKNKDNGTNGAVAMGTGYGSRSRINSSILLNHKADKWNIGLGYDNRFAGRTKYITKDRVNFQLPDQYFINQTRDDERYERLQNLKLNIDFTPNKRNNFALEIIGSKEGQDNDETLVSIIKRQNNSFNNGDNRRSFEYQKANIGEMAASFERKFEDDRKSLSASFSSSLENGKENTYITTLNLTEKLVVTDAPFLQKTHNYENGIISNAKIDYAIPISKNGIFEVGYKGIFRSVKTDFEYADKVGADYVINLGSTNVFDFHENVHAIYGLFHSVFGNLEHPKWKYEIGLRAENVNNNGATQTKSTNFTNQYLKVFPTANLVYNQSDDAFWKISYGKRINRPGLGALNPFTDITDALNPHSGNPYLKPEIIHALELGYNKEMGDYSISSSLFYRHSLNTIRNFFVQKEGGILLNLPVNIGTADSYGLENIFTGKPSLVYNFNASVTLFQQKLNGSNINSDAVQSSFNWFGKLINNFNVSKSGKLQIIGNYTSAATTPQGRLIPLYYVDLGYQQKLGKGNARLGFVVVDVFNSLKSGNNNTTSKFINNRTQKADTRAAMLTFAYSFKSVFKEKLLDNQFSKEF